MPIAAKPLFLPLGFDELGKPDASEAAGIADALRSDATRPLLVLSHGWRNSETYATSLYTELLQNVAKRLASFGPKPQPIAVGLFWPSLQFPEADGLPKSTASRTAAASSTKLEPELLRRRLDELKASLSDAAAVDQAIAALNHLESDPAGRASYVDAIKRLIGPPRADPAELNAAQFLRLGPEELFGKLKAPAPPRSLPSPHGGALAMGTASAESKGLMDRIDGLADSFMGSAWRMLNYLTYFQMKERAGVVGEGLAGVLGTWSKDIGQRSLHLVGHSFGARLVTAATFHGGSMRPNSVCLLQGAFSHNGFGTNYDGRSHDGFFRSVVSAGMVRGAILVTHTANDEAVGTAYPIASRISQTMASALGDEHDIYGGIGRNGALHLRDNEVATLQMLPADKPYTFKTGLVSNLAAGDLIKNHGDVTNPAVANVVAHAVALF